MNRSLFVFAFLLLLSTVFAAGIEFGRENKVFYLEAQTQVAETILVKNTTNSKQCFDVTVDTGDRYLEADTGTNYFCLNEDEETEVTVSIRPQTGISNGSYTVTTTFFIGTDEVPVRTPVKIGDTGTLDFELGTTTICQETAEIGINFKNRESKTKTISINAENPSLLPTFRTEEFQLYANEERTAFLRVNASRAQEADYDYFVTATDENSVIVKKGTLSIIQCGIEFDYTDFELTSPVSCIEANPGDTVTLTAQLRNLTNRDTRFDIDASSNRFTITNLLETLTVAKNETRSFPVSIRIPTSTEVGTYDIEVTATTNYETQSTYPCVKIRGQTETVLLQNQFRIEQGDHITFQVDVKNKTGFEQEVRLRFTDLENGFEGEFSTSSFTLPGNSSRTVNATIFVPENASTGERTFNLRTITNNQTTNTTVYLKVLPVSDPDPSARYLRFVSYPTHVDINAGQIKRLTFILQNTYRKPVENINITVPNLPSYMKFETAQGITIDANDAVQINVILRIAENAPSEINRLTVTASNGTYYTEAPLEITTHQTATGPVQPKPPAPGQNGIWAGLASFASQNFAWIGLAFILFMLLLLVLLQLNASSTSKNNQQPPWLKRY